MFARNPHNIPCACEPGMSVPHASFGLKLAISQPLVRKDEARATVVVLAIFNSNRASVSQDGAMFRHPIRHAGEDFRQVERRIGIVMHPKKKHLTVEVMHATDGALRDVGRQR